MKYGLQLFSVRDSAEKDYEGTLARVAEMGYSMIETAGFFDHSAKEVKAMADRCGLTICGTHTSGKALFEDLDATVELHRELGCKDIIIPHADFSTKENVDYFVENVNRVIPILKEEGITLHYHNHSIELLPNKDGQIALNELLARTEIKLEVDTFWIYNARLDPVEFIEKHKDRITTIHVKDGIENSDEMLAQSPNRGTECRSLGSGNVPVAAIREKAIELGIEMVVESEGLDPTGLEEVKRCIDYLRSLDNI